MTKTKKEIKAFFQQLVDERIDLAEELMHVVKSRAREHGVKVTRIDLLNGVKITTIEDPFADPKEMVLRSGDSRALVKLGDDE